jgi:hypothetical protein
MIGEDISLGHVGRVDKEWKFLATFLKLRLSEKQCLGARSTVNGHGPNITKRDAMSAVAI